MKLPPPLIPALSPRIEKMALELAFARPAEDASLLPIHSLLAEAEEIAAAHSLPEPFSGAFISVRASVDSALENGAFTRAHIAFLNAWVTWMQNGLANDPEDFPPAWQPTAEQAPELMGSPSASGAAPAPAPPPEQMNLNLAQDAELFREFVTESLDHLQNIELSLLELEENPASIGALNCVFRAFHTFKGSAGFLRLHPVERLAHELETLLDAARQHRIEIQSHWIEAILAGKDLLKDLVINIHRALEHNDAELVLTCPSNLLVDRVRALSAPSMPAAKPPALSSELPETQHAPQPQSISDEAPSTLRVDLHKLDALMDLVGELMIAESLVVQEQTAAASSDSKIARHLSLLNRVTVDLQKTAMSLRMVPIRATFQKLPRLVRDLSSQCGKSIDLRLIGEETELDRTVVSEIQDPLIHMVRNAVDHGIETSSERTAAGKPAQGTLRISACHQGNRIVIEIRDDGKGLNPSAIRARAVEKGLIRPEEIVPPDALYRFIFQPGFSTASRITELSGRGVGMDVVLRQVEKLRGKIDVASVPGHGVTFTLSFPLTLAIIDGLVVRIGSQPFVIPSLSVREAFPFRAEAVSTVSGQHEIINVRGQFSPLLRLRPLFHLAPLSQSSSEIVLLIEARDKRRCLLVDELIGKQEIVIKGLGDLFSDQPLLAGAAILGDGQVGLILDPSGLVQFQLAA